MSLEQELYSRAKMSLESQGEYSLSAFSSTDSDRVRFDSYPPSTMFGVPSTFSGVLNVLRPRFALEAWSPHIRAAIGSRLWPEDEVYLYGYPEPVRIVDDASQLASTPDIYLLAWVTFVRADMSLVLWGDSDELLLSVWTDIISRIQNQFGSVVTVPTLMAGLSEYPQTEGNNLPPLDDFQMLSTVDGSTTLSPIPETIQPFVDAEAYLHPLWSSTGSESLDLGSLRFGSHTPNNPSPSSDNTSPGIGDSPLTANLGSISPYPIDLMGLSLSEEEDTSVLSSSDVTTFISDEEGSPVLSNNSGSTILHHPPGPVLAPSATGSSSFRRHSVGEANAPAVRAIGQKTKRGIGEEDVVYSGFPSITVEGGAFTNDVDRRIASGIRASKRSRSSVVETATATSAPALLSVPLPNVEHARDDSESSGSLDEDSTRLLANLPPLAPPSSASIPSPSSSPSPAPAASTRAAPPSGSQRRTRRRGGGSSARPKRTPCEFCNKTFSRIQDAQRHMTTSCSSSPNKAGVECPECRQVLSRLDAAQRHWRQHENPTCAPPEWALRA